MPSRRVVSAERVVTGGCAFFLRYATVDMDALAGSLSVSRATLYRVARSRDRLLGDVLWRLAERLLEQARMDTSTTGVDGVLDTTRRFAVAVRRARPFRAFLHAEPATAARVLFTPAGGVHIRVVEAQKAILAAAAADPAWSPGDLDGAAFLRPDHRVHVVRRTDHRAASRSNYRGTGRPGRARILLSGRCDGRLSFPPHGSDAIDNRLWCGQESRREGAANMARPRRTAVLAAGLVVTLASTMLAATPGHATGTGEREPVARATVRGPVPGDPLADRLADTYPFFSTPFDLAGRGYVEEEFYLSGLADGWDTAGNRVATDVAYQTRLVVRRPADPRRFSGVALVEWQNVTAAYDLDALWNAEATTRSGDAWIGVSAQRVGVDQLRGWSPTRYGRLDVTGGGRYVADELSYDIFAQAGKAVADPRGVSPLGRLRARTVLAIGASQSAGRLTVYYDRVLPRVRPVFEGYGFVVGSAPARVGAEPVFQVLSETDVRTPVRPADTDRFRRWEVAGAAHSGYHGQVYRAPIQERDLGAAPVYTCARPPFSRVPMHHVTAAAYAHLARWVDRDVPPPTAPPLVFNADGTKARDAYGIARGGIRLSQVAVPTALNTGDNAGESFCVLFGTYQRFDAATLDLLYPTRVGYVARVVAADVRNIAAGYLRPADAAENLREAMTTEVD